MTQENFILTTGGMVSLETRPGTNDHNVAYSILTEDEYHFDAVKPLQGVALDVGAHIGAATVALLELNPDLRVIAIEPVPANIELLRMNTARYGDRVTILEAAAGTNGTIYWNFRGNESAEHHRFIGNQHFSPDTQHDTIHVDTVTLTELVDEYGPIAFLKIDAEGAEDTFLDDPAIDQVERIAAEYHNGPSVRVGFDKPERKPKRRKRVAK